MRQLSLMLRRRNPLTFSQGSMAAQAPSHGSQDEAILSALILTVHQGHPNFKRIEQPLTG